jgi:hypothetical protein
MSIFPHYSLCFVVALSVRLSVTILCFLFWCCCSALDPLTIQVKFATMNFMVEQLLYLDFVHSLESQG